MSAARDRVIAVAAAAGRAAGQHVLAAAIVGSGIAAFAGIAPSSAAAFVGAQVIGGALAIGIIKALYPGARRQRLRSLSLATGSRRR